MKDQGQKSLMVEVILSWHHRSSLLKTHEWVHEGNISGAQLVLAVQRWGLIPDPVYRYREA